jgi:tRNA(Ile)-lysidine synthase TilS/MesJ
LTKDDVIKMAKQAGIKVEPSAINGEPYIDDRAFFEGRVGNIAGDGFRRPSVFAAIERFAQLVAAQAAAAEREACAKVCDEQAKEPECPERAAYCSAAIRARGTA